MSVQRKDNKAKPSVDGVTTPHLNTKVHGGKSTGQDAYYQRLYSANKLNQAWDKLKSAKNKRSLQQFLIAYANYE